MGQHGYLVTCSGRMSSHLSAEPLEPLILDLVKQNATPELKSIAEPLSMGMVGLEVNSVSLGHQCN